MIRYRDFVPTMRSASSYLRQPEFESLDEALAQCNDWVKSNDVDLVSIETVVLPNIHQPHEEGSSDVDLRQDDEFVHTRWHQFVRVWFRGE